MPNCGHTILQHNSKSIIFSVMNKTLPADGFSEKDIQTIIKLYVTSSKLLHRVSSPVTM